MITSEEASAAIRMNTIRWQQNGAVFQLPASMAPKDQQNGAVSQLPVSMAPQRYACCAASLLLCCFAAWLITYLLKISTVDDGPRDHGRPSSSGKAQREGERPACWPPSPLRAGSFATVRDYCMYYRPALPPERIRMKMPSSNYCRAGATSMDVRVRTSGQRPTPALWHLWRLAIRQAWTWARACIDHGEFSMQEGLVL